MNFSDLPSGLTIRLSLTDRDATAFVGRYLTEHNKEIKDLIQQKLKFNPDITEPRIQFDQDEILLSAKVGIRFMKANARLTASVCWKGNSVDINIKTLELPIVTLDASKANSLIKKPIEDFVGQLQQDFNILSFTVEAGSVTIDAVKK